MVSILTVRGLDADVARGVVCRQCGDDDGECDGVEDLMGGGQRWREGRREGGKVRLSIEWDGKNGGSMSSMEMDGASEVDKVKESMK